MLDRNNFIIKEIPNLHPLSRDYKKFWKELKRRSIEGYWSGGYYCPSGLYFYTNLGTILRNANAYTNAKVLLKPELRDTEWYLMREWTLARGFSGFEGDESYTGNRIVFDESLSAEDVAHIDPTAVRQVADTYFVDGEEIVDTNLTVLKKKPFRDPRHILSAYYDKAAGRALFNNEAQNVLYMGSRDTGKSYLMGQGIALHQWLISGQTVYVDPEKQDRNYKVNPIELTVGAEDSKFSTLLLDKTKVGYDNLPGKYFVGDRMYPSPMTQRYVGSFASGSKIVAEYKKKYKGGWDTVSGSIIKHRTFRDNPFADQGSRPLAIILDEVGIFKDLKAVYANTKDNLRDGLRKIGSLVMGGTGGNIDEATADVQEMFYNPESFDIVCMEDKWEHKGMIGTFIPAYMALNKYKDENGNTREEDALKEIDAKRAIALKGSGGSEAYNKEIQYRPIKPSEIFLSKAANIFPSAEIRHRLSVVTDNDLHTKLGNKVTLYFDSNSTLNGVNYTVDPTLPAVRAWPHKEDDTSSSLIIYEFPHIDPELGKVPKNAYVIGYDPIKDNVNHSRSFGCFHVMKTSLYPTTVGTEEIVATYFGRPYEGVNVINELLYKTSMFYGDAPICFENAVGNTKDYFEKVKRLDLLMQQPTTVLNRKAAQLTNEKNILYGYPMSNDKVKWEALQYVRTWILTKRDDVRLNLDTIVDKLILQQLLMFDLKGNYDAVMALVGCIIGLEELHNRKKNRDMAENGDVSFYNVLTNNKKLFKAIRVNQKT